MRTGVAALVILVLLTAGLAGFHWYKGASLESSIRVAFDDYRVAAECRDPDVILDFVDRSALEAGAIGLAERFGANWVRQVCRGSLKLLRMRPDSGEAPHKGYTLHRNHST